MVTFDRLLAPRPPCHHENPDSRPEKETTCSGLDGPRSEMPMEDECR